MCLRRQLYAWQLDRIFSLIAIYSRVSVCMNYCLAIEDLHT